MKNDKLLVGAQAGLPRSLHVAAYDLLDGNEANSADQAVRDLRGCSVQALRAGDVDGGDGRHFRPRHVKANPGA